MPNPNQIALVDPETQRLVGLDDPAQLPGLVNLGYRPASPEEVQAHALRQHYETLGQTAGAFGEGAIDTLLPVVAPALERALGVSAEDQRLRAQFHPVARGAGMVGAGILGAATGVGAPGAFAKLGAGAAGAVGGGVLGTALGEATQGLLYSASDVANRAVMQDPGLTAEAALREVGTTTAIAGGLGALGGLARRFAADHADQWSRDLQDFAADRVLKTYGGIQSNRKSLVARFGEAGYLERMKEIAHDPLLRPGPFDTSATLFDKSTKALDEAWGSMQAELQKAGTAGATVSGDALLQKFRAVVSQADSNPFVPKSAVARLDDMLDKYSTGYAGKDLPVEGVHALRKQLSDVMRMSGPGGPRVLDFDGNIALGSMHEWRDAMSDAIEGALDESGTGSAAWTAANRRFHVAKIAQNLAQTGISRAQGNNAVSLTELLTGGAAALAGGAGEEGGALSHVLGRGLLGTAASALVRRQGANALFWIGDRASKALGALHAGVDTEITQAIDRAFAGAAGAISVRAAQAFTPANFADRSAEVNRRLADASPQVSDPVLDSFALPVMDQMRQRVQAAASTMGAAIPKYDQTGPLDPAYQPSATELARLNRVAEVAADPLAVLARLADGTLTADHVQALDAVWPAYAAAIRVRALGRVATGMAKRETFDNRLRSGLAVLVGQDLGRSTSPAAIAAAQSAYAARAPNPQGPPPPGSQAEGRRVRNVETKLSRRTATSTDAAISHLQEA